MLQTACAYQGGKSRIAKQIIDLLFTQNEINENTHFYDLCCGSGAISLELVNQGISPQNMTMLDKGVWGMFWKKVGEGSFNIERFETFIHSIPKDPSFIQAFMQNLAKQPADVDTVYVYLLLQASAFGSKQIWIENNEWKNTSFRNYWLPTETSNRKSPVNPMMPMPSALLERVRNIVSAMKGVRGIFGDIDTIREVEDNTVVIIDPPYMGTTKYKDTVDILKTVRQIGHTCYVCEGKKILEQAFQITSTRKKGGISGTRKSTNEEWLNVLEP